LKVPVRNIEGVFEIVDTSTLPSGLFLKHLIVLSNFGGENLKRISAESQRLFPNQTIDYLWEYGAEIQKRTYTFKAFPNKKFSNTSLGLIGTRLFNSDKLTDVQKDAVAVILLGASSTDILTANILSKCEISGYLGHPDKLEQFIRQRYIWVSQVNAGEKSNSMGQLAQKFVYAYLHEHIGIAGVTFSSNGHIPDVRHVLEGDVRLTTFDLVVQYGEKYVAVEISFQVTTNSVIERKSGQAQERYKQIHAKNGKIAYVLDGAGNFERKSALRTLCAFSDCTVAFSQSELHVLTKFIRDYFTNG